MPALDAHRRARAAAASDEAADPDDDLAAAARIGLEATIGPLDAGLGQDRVGVQAGCDDRAGRLDGDIAAAPYYGAASHGLHRRFAGQADEEPATSAEALRDDAVGLRARGADDGAALQADANRPTGAAAAVRQPVGDRVAHGLMGAAVAAAAADRLQQQGRCCVAGGQDLRA
ncbi:hypothetical protein ACU4GR_03785 [Methylobacterium oryzae CBMB20]